MSKVRGSYYVDGRRSLTLITSDHDKLVDIGFRLAHDGIDQHRYRRGRSFTVLGDEAMVGIVLEDFPEFQNARIGIRLTADWSGT